MKTTNLLKGLGLIIMMLCLSPTNMDAQFLKDIARSAKRKIANKIERKVVETISDEIARRAFRPINDVMDDWIRENMKKDTLYTGVSDDSLAIIMRENYATIMGSMNRAGDLPPSYAFDYVMDITVTDGKDINKMKMMLSKSVGVIGIEQMEGNEKQLMVMDLDKDLIAIYDQKNKTVQALAGMMSLGSAMARSSMADHSFEVNKKGGSKTIAGYNATELEIKSEDYITNAWISTDAPFDWNESYGLLVQRFSPKSFNQAGDELGKGLMLESTTKEFGKKKGKYKSESHWLTTNISASGLTIDNTAYKPGFE